MDIISLFWGLVLDFAQVFGGRFGRADVGAENGGEPEAAAQGARRDVVGVGGGGRRQRRRQDPHAARRRSRRLSRAGRRAPAAADAVDADVAAHRRPAARRRTGPARLSTPGTGRRRRRIGPLFRFR